MVNYDRYGLFNDNLKTGTMKEEEADKLLSKIVKGMIDLGMYGHEHIHDTPINTIFLGISSAIIATGSSGSDDDMKQSSVDLLEALAAVIKSSRLIKEIDIQNQINDLLD